MEELDFDSKDVGIVMLGGWLILEGQEWYHLGDRKIIKTFLLAGGTALYVNGLRETTTVVEGKFSEYADQVDDFVLDVLATIDEEVLEWLK